jgi:7-cyano-7-deazaguanine synthase in queuosine biosynthesis
VTHPPAPAIVLCNGAKPTGKTKPKDATILDYLGPDAKVKVLLPDFVRDVYHLPNRVLDLLEIAAYVFAADRSLHRGEKGALEYHGWSRSMRLFMKVRDHKFWQQKRVQQKLSAALEFMSGDRSYEFVFQPGHSTPATGLFDTEAFTIAPQPGTQIAMFSGGLDSLAGIVESLSSSDVQQCLISHQSGQTGTVRTQNQLFQALDTRFPKRLRHYRFKCGLQGERADEETQRTRAFLYASTAFALASALKMKSIIAYENGVTAINFPRRADLMHARASRTTHPKTIWLMQDFLSEMLGEPFKIETPFIWKTKSDVLAVLKDRGLADLVSSSVSCSKTFQNLGQAPQCGGCSQCIDRRFAAFAADMQDVDHSGLYAHDFLTEAVSATDVRTTLVDFVRQAQHFARWNVDHYQEKLLNELTDVVGYAGLNDTETIERCYALCKAHGSQVETAIKRMRDKYDQPFAPAPANDSFLKIVGGREHLAEASHDYAGLIKQLELTPPGLDAASAFERIAHNIIQAVFSPDLTNGKPQQHMDGGRKRIDLVFDNKAGQGFFAGLRDNHKKTCAWVLFECKNYSQDIKNTEFAQLRDRLGSSTTEVGIIICRKVHDADAILKHCQDRSSGSPGGIVIMVLDDADLRCMLDLRAKGRTIEITKYLDDKLRAILFRT